MKYAKKLTAVLMSAVLLAGSSQALPPQFSGSVQPYLTASAAEEDYPWSDYLKKSADWFGSQEAIAVADACIQYQVANEGGWQKGMATAHTGDWAHSTIDNDATTSQIRFLMRTYAQTKQQKYLDCAMRGVDCLFKMQYSNGGFMQCLNTPGTYHSHITLNDGAYLHVMSILKEMSRKSGDFTAVSDAYAQKASAALEKGIQCLLNMQIVNNGVKTAWCQQYDENTLAPAPARAYELPSTCSSESAGVVQFLYQMAKETGRNDLIESVNAAITWFKKVQLNGIAFVKQGDDKVVVQDANASPLWARFYELGTDRPLFSDRDSSVHYDVSEISKERRTGYAWYGNWGKNVTGLALLEPGTDPGTVTEPEYSGTLISKLVVHDISHGDKWSIQRKLNVGSKIYGDRDFTVVTTTAEILNAEYVQPACDSKTYSGDLAELTAAQDITVYVLLDMRLPIEQGINPPWLKGWTQLDRMVNSSNTVSYIPYAKELNAGETVTLGSNMTGQNAVNYFVAVMPRESETEPPVTTTTTTVTTTTTTTAITTTTTTVTTATTPVLPEKVSGDADCSSTVDVSDAVLILKFLSGDSGAKITDAGLRNADCDGKQGVTEEDVTVILRYIAKLIREFPA